jgi:DNA-binding Lrp family transcriptional regulator
VTRAVVLIEAERDSFTTLGAELARIDGVREAWSVTGDWDFLALVEVEHHEDLAGVVIKAISQMPGVERTQTMVAFEKFG